MSDLFDQNTLIITQKKEWLEIVSGFETSNKYSIYKENSEEIGLILEKSKGFKSALKRLILRSHRPLDVEVLDRGMIQLLRFHRPFFWFFSDMHVEQDGKKIGSIHRRFSFFYKKYDLVDANGMLFATISSPFWKLWTFPIKDLRSNLLCTVSKKWQGLLKEAFTDSDSFVIKYQGASDETHRKIILAAAISIDFDFFENNQGSGSLLDMLNG